MELLGGWDRVRRNLVGTFFIQARATLLQREIPTPDEIILRQQTYSVETLPLITLEREYQTLADLDEALEKAREDYANKKKEFELRWTLTSDSNKLLEKFILNFYHYYETSNRKKESIQKLQAQYDQELAEKSRDVSRLTKELAKLKEVSENLKKRLEICHAYKDFMRSVVEESKGEFESISQVMSRYHELMAIRRNHVEKTVTQVESAFELEKELKEMQQESKFEDIACKTYLSDLEEYQNRLQVSMWRRHDNLLAIKAGLRREVLQAYTPKIAIYNLYLLLCNEMEQPVKLKPSQFREQLMFIRKFLNELTKILNRTQEALEAPSNRPLMSVKSERAKFSIKM